MNILETSENGKLKKKTNWKNYSNYGEILEKFCYDFSEIVEKCPNNLKKIG